MTIARKELASKVFIDRLDKEIKNRNLTYRRVEEMCGLPVASLSTMFNTGRPLSLASAIKLAKTLRISLDWLCGLQ